MAQQSRVERTADQVFEADRYRIAVLKAKANLWAMLAMAVAIILALLIIPAVLGSLVLIDRIGGMR